MNVTMHGHMNVTMHGHVNVTMHGHMNVTMHGHMNVKYMQLCVTERIFFCTGQGVSNKTKTAIQDVPVFFPSNQVSLKSAKLRIASKLILRSRKICPRLDSLDFSNNFLCHSQMFADIYYRIHSQQFRVAMEREAKKSLCYCCARRWEILFLEGKDCFTVLQCSPNLCSYI
jgi:hypothetical protein